MLQSWTRETWRKDLVTGANNDGWIQHKDWFFYDSIANTILNRQDSSSQRWNIKLFSENIVALFVLENWKNLRWISINYFNNYNKTLFTTHISQIAFGKCVSNLQQEWQALPVNYTNLESLLNDQFTTFFCCQT